MFGVLGAKVLGGFRLLLLGHSALLIAEQNSSSEARRGFELEPRGLSELTFGLPKALRINLPKLCQMFRQKCCKP